MIVRQAANVLELLEYFADLKKPSTMPEISDAMGWPRSSTYNLLATLEEHGFLYEPRSRAGFYPSTRWNSLVQIISESDILPDELIEAAAAVAKATGETTAIAAPSRANAVLIHVVESKAVVRFAAQIGFQTPIHATAAGRALLEQYSAAERTSLLRKVNYQKYLIGAPMNAAEVEEQITRAIKRGWHVAVGNDVDLAGVAIPVGSPDRCMSMVVGGPTSRMGKRLPEIAAILKEELRRSGYPCAEAQAR